MASMPRAPRVPIAASPRSRIPHDRCHPVPCNSGHSALCARPCRAEHRNCGERRRGRPALTRSRFARSVETPDQSPLRQAGGLAVPPSVRPTPTRDGPVRGCETPGQRQPPGRPRRGSVRRPWRRVAGGRARRTGRCPPTPPAVAPSDNHRALRPMRPPPRRGARLSHSVGDGPGGRYGRSAQVPAPNGPTGSQPPRT